VQRLGVPQQDVDLAVMLRVITILWLLPNVNEYLSHVIMNI
jgi:hypothetical protein